MFGGAEVRLLRESGGEFGVGNVSKDVGNVTLINIYIYVCILMKVLSMCSFTLAHLFL